MIKMRRSEKKRIIDDFHTKIEKTREIFNLFDREDEKNAEYFINFCLDYESVINYCLYLRLLEPIFVLNFIEILNAVYLISIFEKINTKKIIEKNKKKKGSNDFPYVENFDKIISYVLDIIFEENLRKIVESFSSVIYNIGIELDDCAFIIMRVLEKIFVDLPYVRMMYNEKTKVISLSFVKSEKKEEFNKVINIDIILVTRKETNNGK